MEVRLCFNSNELASSIIPHTFLHPIPLSENRFLTQKISWMPRHDSALRSFSIWPSTSSTLAYKGKEKRINTNTGSSKTRRWRICGSNYIGSAGLNTPNVWFSHKSKALRGYNVFQPRKWFRLRSAHERFVSCRDISWKKQQRRKPWLKLVRPSWTTTPTMAGLQTMVSLKL